MIQLHRRSCNLCEAICGLQVEIDGDRIVSIKGDPDDPHSRGFICPKAVALKDLQEDPERLRQPMRRTAQGWQPISWSKALDEAGQRIAQIQKTYGADALGIYWGNPPTHNHGLVLTMNPVFAALRTRNRYSAASIDQLPAYLVSRLMFGNQLLFPLPDVDRTDYWLILGANPLASNGSIGSGPDMRRRIGAIQARGGQVVVVDPRRSETAAIASMHVSIRPGGDVWLLLGMLQVICEQRQASGLAGKPAPHISTTVAAEFAALIADCTPESMAALAGIPASTIRQLAHDFAAAPSAVAYGRLGVSQTTHATLCHWLINLLNLITGNFDRAGGAMFSTPAFDIRTLARWVAGGGRYARWRSRVRGLPEFSDELPVATLADEMITPGPGQIKALLLVAGNPVLSSPNGARLDAAMSGLDFCVAIDYYINESTRHADLILPPVTVWERGHFEAAVNAVQVHNVARYSAPALAAPVDGREDWQILTDLLARVEHHHGGGRRLLGALWHGVHRLLTPDRLLDLALRLGPHGRWRGRPAGLTLERLRVANQTMDLGPLMPTLPAASHTPGKQVDVLPDILRTALEKLLLNRSPTAPTVEDENAGATLLLIGRRQLRTNNSWMHNFKRLVKGPPACTLLMHPDDAARRGVHHDDPVQVRSRVGHIVATLSVSDEMRTGVVSLPHGWGHHHEGTRQSIAHAHAGVSINDLTDERCVDTVSGNAAVNGVPVEVTPVAG